MFPIFDILLNNRKLLRDRVEFSLISDIAFVAVIRFAKTV